MRNFPNCAYLQTPLAQLSLATIGLLSSWLYINLLSPSSTDHDCLDTLGNNSNRQLHSKFFCWKYIKSCTKLIEYKGCITFFYFAQHLYWLPFLTEFFILVQICTKLIEYKWCIICLPCTTPPLLPFFNWVSYIGACVL